MRRVKLILAVVFLTLFASILYTQKTGNLYPILLLWYAGSIILFLLKVLPKLCGSSKPRKIPIAISIPILLSTATRLYIISFPVSIIGIDPPKTIIPRTQNVIQANSTEALTTNFYPGAPNFFLLNAIVAKISGVAGLSSIKIYPLLVGIVLPLIGACTAMHLVSSKKTYVGALTATLISIPTATIQYSYWPIPQTLGVLFWSLSLFFISKWYNRKSNRTLLMLLLSVISALYTHKLPLLLITATIMASIILLVLYRFLPDNWHPNALRDQTDRYGFILLFLLILFLFYQWTYATDYILKIVGKLIVVLTAKSATIAPTYNVSAAVEPYPNLFGVFYRRGHAITLILFSGIAWIFTAFYHRSQENLIPLLAAASVGVCLLALSILAPAEQVLAPLRVLFAIEFILAIILSIFLASYSNSFTKIILIVLVISQVFAPGTLPNYPNTPRYYLSEEETSAKDFRYEYINTDVYTDAYGYVAATPSSLKKGRDSRKNFKPLNEELYNHNLLQQQYEYLLLRTNVDVYWTDIRNYRLIWNPSRAAARNYNKIYTSDGGQIYKRSTLMDDLTSTIHNP